MTNKQLLFTILFVAVLCSCSKNHYDTSQINGVQVEGECQIPVLSASYTLGDLIKSVGFDSVVSFEEGGNLNFLYSFKQDDVLKGSDFMKFNGFEFNAHFSIDDLLGYKVNESVDTLLKLDYFVELESDNLIMKNGKVGSGSITFDLGTQGIQVNSLVLRSDDIVNENGTPLEISTTDMSHPVVINLAGMRFDAENSNVLSFSNEIQVTIGNGVFSGIALDVQLSSTDISIQEMNGWVEKFEVGSCLDTAFSLFNESFYGVLDLKGADVMLTGRNGFGLDARLRVDTAWLVSEEFGYSSIFYPLPLEAVLPVSTSEYVEVFHRKLDMHVDSHSTGLLVSSDVVFNPNEYTGMVYLNDTSTIDLGLDINVPMSFSVDEFKYIDTIEMNIVGVDMPDLIKELVLEITLSSTLPLNCGCELFLYDSEQCTITELMVDDNLLVMAPSDGQPVMTFVNVSVDDEKIQDFLNADGLILKLRLDTDDHSVELKADQKLDMFLKTRVRYDGVVE